MTHCVESEPDGRVCLVVFLYAVGHQQAHFLHVVLRPVQVCRDIILGCVTAGVREGVSRGHQAAVLLHKVTEDRLLTPIHQSNLKHIQSFLMIIFYNKEQYHPDTSSLASWWKLYYNCFHRLWLRDILFKTILYCFQYVLEITCVKMNLNC